MGKRHAVEDVLAAGALPAVPLERHDRWERVEWGVNALRGTVSDLVGSDISEERRAELSGELPGLRAATTDYLHWSEEELAAAEADAAKRLPGLRDELAAHPALPAGAEESERALQEYLADLVRGVSPIAEDRGHPPLALLFGGQPGSGKTRLQNALTAARIAPAASYDGDRNAHLHPGARRIFWDDPLRGHTTAADALVGGFHDRALGHLRAGPVRYDVLASHPLAREEWAAAWAQGFRDHGYRVVVAYVATHQANSLLGTLARYQGMRDVRGYGRWMSVEHHDGFAAALPGVAAQLESQGLVDALYVLNRDGRVLYANQLGPRTGLSGAAASAIRAERARRPTADEVARFRSVLGFLRDDTRRANGAPDELAERVDEAEQRFERHLEASGAR